MGTLFKEFRARRTKANFREGFSQSKVKKQIARHLALKEIAEKIKNRLEKNKIGLITGKRDQVPGLYPNEKPSYVPLTISVILAPQIIAGGNINDTRDTLIRAGIGSAVLGAGIFFPDIRNWLAGKLKKKVTQKEVKKMLDEQFIFSEKPLNKDDKYHNTKLMNTALEILNDIRKTHENAFNHLSRYESELYPSTTN